MKKQIYIFIAAILFIATGCSKDNNKPIDELLGTWKATSMKQAYQNKDGSPYRDQWITEDDLDNNPNFSLVVSKNSVISIGEEGTGEEMPYSAGRDHIEISYDGERLRLSYTVSGNTLILKSTETDVNIYDDVIVGKILTTITMLKQ